MNIFKYHHVSKFKIQPMYNCTDIIMMSVEEEMENI